MSSRANSDKIEPLDGAKSGHSARHGAKRDAAHRASAVTTSAIEFLGELIWPTGGRFFTPFGLRWLRFVMPQHHFDEAALPKNVKTGQAILSGPHLLVL